MDIVFVLDTSGSLNSVFVQNVLNFVSRIVESFQVGNSGVQVGVIQFDSDVRVVIPLAQFSDRSRLLTEITGLMTSAFGRTNILEAINAARAQLTGANSRPQAKKLLFLLTDGEPTSDRARTNSAADMAKAQQIEIFTFGVGTQISANTLGRLASPPNSTHVFQADDFQESTLNMFLIPLSQATCRGR